jgi:hypothetical protein
MKAPAPKPSAAPLWHARVGRVGVLLGLVACGVVAVTTRLAWMWALLVPAGWIVAAWCRSRVRSWSWWQGWSALRRAGELTPFASGIEGAEAVVRGRMRCDQPVTSALLGSPCAAYVSRRVDLVRSKRRSLGFHGPLDPRLQELRSTVVGDRLAIEQPDGARIPLQAGPWRLLDPLGDSTLEGEARIEDGDDVAVRGQVSLGAEPGDDYRGVRALRTLRADPGLLMPAGGRYRTDRIDVRTSFAGWKWPVMFLMAVVPGALARPVRYALTHHPPARWEAALRLTYAVDVAAAYDGQRDTGKVMQQARRVVAARLDATSGLGSQFSTVTTNGTDLVVEFPAFAVHDHSDLVSLKGLIVRGGRIAFQTVDDPASAQVFGAPALAAEHLPEDEGFGLYTEAYGAHGGPVPDGWEPSGESQPPVKGAYARVSCQPPKFGTETPSECLTRLRSWASRIRVPDDHVIGFEAILEQQINSAHPMQYRTVGWRTLYLFAHPELTGADITDARGDPDPHLVHLTFAPAGARRLKQIKGDTDNRRLAIVLDGVVEEAPLLKSGDPRLGDGKVTITEKPMVDARSDVRELVFALPSGALPAPMVLAKEEPIRAQAKSAYTRVRTYLEVLFGGSEL